tara:strand:+ start:863 stop:1030 length:168 start_codon:yes stop_codon:yes gene_type:complete
MNDQKGTLEQLRDALVIVSEAYIECPHCICGPVLQARQSLEDAVRRLEKKGILWN